MHDAPLHRRLLALPGAVWSLAVQQVMTGLRPRGAYWTWRWETAFGRGIPPRGELLRGLIDYGAWIARMKRLG